MAKIEKDEISGTDTTGHEWDGIKELNTPLPRWWLWTFYATVIWGIGYCIFYPAIPLINSATTGVLGYSSRAEVAKEIEKAKDAQGVFVTQIREASLTEIRNNDQLYDFARVGGRSAFLVNCSQCHGSGAAGGVGYPNLNDDAWIWGGQLEEIYHTIAHGIRYEPDEDTRFSQMPAFGVDGILDTKQISDVADYVLTLSGAQFEEGKAPEKAVLENGKALYEENCAACHQENGSGDHEQGAPALNDAIWLYGGDKQTIVHTIRYSRYGIMPSWNQRLDDETIKKLAIYVHSLGGGEVSENPDNQITGQLDTNK